MLLKNKKFIVIVLLVLLPVILISATATNNTPEQKVKLYTAAQLDTLERELVAYKKSAEHETSEQLQERFKRCRILYKRIEFLVEYYYPAAANRINGAPLLEAEPSEPEEPQHPTGFQVLEAPVYDKLTEESRLVIANEISSIVHQVRRVKNYLEELETDDVAIFDALRLNIYRLIAKGISGFDSPVALNNIPEAQATLESMKEVLSYYKADAALTEKHDAAISFTAQYPDFNSFDRAVFTAQYINPLLQELHDFQVENKIAFVRQDRAIDPAAPHQFSSKAYNEYFFAPQGTKPASAEQVALGKRFFHDPLFSSNGKRSCASCHIPGKAFADGLSVNTSLFGNKQLSRNTPTLINSALQPVQFADSRINFLEDQVHAVVSNREEMDGQFDKIVAAIGKQKEYKNLFAQAFPGDKSNTETNVKKALAAYVRSLTTLNSRFDQYMRGDMSIMNAEEIAGFNIYMGKAKCGTCHYVPLFSGAVPPLYDKMESEVLGVPANADTLRPVQDADSGKFHLYKMPHQLFSFKTPTLRNIALTAPYMHNGVYKTLEEVIEFYNKGGGSGLGFDIPNQTLASDRLDLTAAEKKALIAFMHTLTDTALAPRQRFH